MELERKEKILEKLKLTERGALFILANHDLCDRIIEENPMWTEKFIEKYNFSFHFLKKLIESNSISHFSNIGDKHAKGGRKMFIFEDEVFGLMSEGSYHQSFFKNMELSVDLYLKLSRLFLNELEHSIIYKSLVEKKSLSDISKEVGVSYHQVRIIFDRGYHKAKKYISSIEEYDTLKEHIKDLELEKKILSTEVFDLKLNNKIEDLNPMKVKVQDVDISKRLRNFLKRKKIESMYELTVIKREDLMKHRDFGLKTLHEVDELMGKYKLEYKK